MARLKVDPADRERFTWRLAAHTSPLLRSPGSVPAALQEGKEANVRLGAELLDGLIVGPNQTYSHHHAIGRTTRRRGFQKGLELQGGEAKGNWGGGMCQISNSFYWVAVQAGMRIVERHRHALDLFPDDRRTVPFGCGATVVYNDADFRFENPFPQPVLLSVRVQEGNLITEFWMADDPGVRIEVVEVGHRFFREGEHWARENRLLRRVLKLDGTCLHDGEIAHNRGRVLYEPSPEQRGESA